MGENYLFVLIVITLYYEAKLFVGLIKFAFNLPYYTEAKNTVPGIFKGVVFNGNEYAGNN